MVKIKVVFIDSGENFLISENRFEVLDKQIFDVRAVYYRNNSTPISKIYNTVLADERASGNEHDFMIFMHGDVDVNIESFFNHLYEIRDNYDVIGLAGTKKMNVSQSPLNWFTSSNEFPESRFGHIIMTDGGNEIECFYNSQYNPNIRDTRVACIDGLCMILGRNVLSSNFTFTENIANFDFYDTDLSLQSVMDYRFRLGVMIERTRHLSVGRSILSENFLESEKKFRERFGIQLKENNAE